MVMGGFLHGDEKIWSGVTEHSAHHGLFVRVQCLGFGIMISRLDGRWHRKGDLRPPDDMVVVELGNGDKTGAKLLSVPGGRVRGRRQSGA